MYVPKDEILKWTNALRSGKYKQTTQHLRDVMGYCCLGVACEVLVKDYQFNPHDDELPLTKNGAPDWLVKIDDNVCFQTHESLVSLNDDKKLTFDEIADILEAVYIHEVLK